ncbi:hypothetical protein GX408_10970 [bacterium]|nr:hypothetical protein [bacterium]
MTDPLHGYHIKATLLNGPVWQLYEVETADGQTFWLARLHHDFVDDQSTALVQGCYREGYGLRHPHIVELLHLDADERTPCLLYEPSKGAVPLFQYVVDHPPDSATTAQWVLQICQALQHAYLHGVPHGCLGWSSLFMTTQGFIKVAFFGSSRLFAYGCQNRPSLFMPYALLSSPQRLRTPDKVSIRDELYTLGALYYQLLTGDYLCQSRTVAELIAEKMEPWQTRKALGEKETLLLDRLLEPNPSLRFSNCREVIDAIQPSELEAAADPWSEKEPSPLKSWLFGWRKKAQQAFSFTFVGMKRRTALTLVLLAIFVFVALLVTWISELDHDEWKDQALYQAFISEQDSLRSLEMRNQKRAEPASPAVQDSRALFHQTRVGSGQVRKEKTGGASAVDTIGVQFVPLMVSAQIDSTLTAADVYINDKLEGQSSLSGPLIIQGLSAARSYTVRVQKQGYAVWQKTITISADADNVLQARLLPLTDALRRYTFSRTSFADRISIDGKLPSMALPLEVDLALGIHELRYIDTVSGFQWTTSLTLDLNSARTIYYQPEQVGMGRLAVVLANPARFGYAFIYLPGQSRTQTTPFRQPLAVGRYALRIFRDGYRTVPSDTTIFIKPNEDLNIVVQMSPM